MYSICYPETFQGIDDFALSIAKQNKELNKEGKKVIEMYFSQGETKYKIVVQPSNDYKVVEVPEPYYKGIAAWFGIDTPTILTKRLNHLYSVI